MKLRLGILMGLLAAAAVSGCGYSGDEKPELMNTRSQTRSPDEFAILPTKPLTMPEDLASLPAPTPGGANLTDPTPDADAVAALGGNPDALKTGTRVAAGSTALLAQAGRFGTAPGIRETLAAEDLEYRRSHDGRLLERMFNVNVYFKAYRPMTLDSYGELAYWRARGLRNVSAPPEGIDLKDLQQ